MMPAVMNNNHDINNGFANAFMFAGHPAGISGNYAGSSGDGDIPNDPGKMFIGGLSWQTTPESIREYFSAFGDLAEVMVMKDPATRRSRGFGFITFSDPNAVAKVLKFPVHQLDGKLVEPKVAVPRKTNPKLVMRTKKIFVGGLSATTSLEDIRAYFEQFSKVKEAMLAYDKVTTRHRGFGFVTFDNEDVVDKICEIHFHEINGKMVESKKALPKEPRLSYYSSYNAPYYSPPGGRFSGTGSHNFYAAGYQQQQQQQSQLPAVGRVGGGGGGGGGGTGGSHNTYGLGIGNDGHIDGHRSLFGRTSSTSVHNMLNNNGRFVNNGLDQGPGLDNPGRVGLPDDFNRNVDLANMMAYYSNNESSSAGSAGENSAAYEDDFPELSAAAKFGQLRLDGDISPVNNNNHDNEFGF